MRVPKDWWKNFFGRNYLVTDARSVLNPRLTRKETNLIEESLRLDKNHKILDLCGGQGRHCLELARRGYKDLTVLDYSDYLVRLGRKITKDKRQRIKFVRRDARATGLKNDDFEAIIVMANSFGYFAKEKENIKVLKEAHRLLKNKGKLLLDLADKAQAKKNLKPTSWHRANDDIVVLRRRRLTGDMIKAREVVISRKKGLLKDGTYLSRLYSKKKIKGILRQAGFKNVKIRDNLKFHRKKKDYGFLTSRMIVVAQKGRWTMDEGRGTKK
jgi:D-alanine-D-alanine ligase